MRPGLKEAFESATGRMPSISLAEFVKFAEDFEVVPLTYRGECRGAMLVKGKEVHACVTPPWYARQALREISKIVKKYGEATTHATTEAGIRMVERLGFVKCGDTYRSTKAWE